MNAKLTAEIIDKRRRQLGLTATKLANDIGVSRATVHNWLNGNVENMRETHAIKLCEILKINLAQLLGFQEIDLTNSDPQPENDKQETKLGDPEKLIETIMDKLKSLSSVDLYQLSMIIDTFIQMKFLR